MTAALLLCAAFLMGPLAQTQAAASAGWEGWKFLLGQWVGEGSGQPGQGSGGFSFVLDLQGKVLVRKNHADYPATKDRPAFSHDDLMVIYHEAGPPAARAIYFDNEGHVIQYDASFSEDGTTWVFLSDAAPSAPRYRLTYTKEKNGMLGIKFEIAPPGKPNAFSTYIEARARREGVR
jgi:hypothetical protein